MSDSPAEQGAQASAARAEIRPPRRLSIVWLIPLAVAAVAGWVAYTSISGQGPSITITFDTADGLEAGKTKIMFKGVQAGTVDSIGISEDLQQVVVHASMAKETEGHLNDETQFWVVRPEVSITGITGLSTLVSGAYIAVQPGDGKPRRAFEGLEQAPISTDKGTRFTLRARELGSLHASSSVHHRGVTVGKVLSYQLAKDGPGVDIQILIDKPYVHLVRKNSLFWNFSGIHVNLRDIYDPSIEVGSIASLLAGGIAFGNPPDPADPAPADTVFELHPDRPDVIKAERAEGRFRFEVLLTTEDLSGIGEDDPVLYREIEIGKVLETRLNAAADGVEIRLGIADEHSGLIRARTVFWNASGLKLNLGDLVDASVEIESVKTLLAGGIALANPTDAATTSSGASGGQGSTPEAAASPASESLPLPTAVALSGEHVSASVLSEALAELGFTNVGNIERSGAIVRVDADWYGETVKLHIDTKTGRIEPIR